MLAELDLEVVPKTTDAAYFAPALRFERTGSFRVADQGRFSSPAFTRRGGLLVFRRNCFLERQSRFLKTYKSAGRGLGFSFPNSVRQFL